MDVAKVLRTYSQDLLRDYEQENGISSIAFDRGPPRENAVRKLLRERLPGRYGVGEGLVIDGHDGQSLQNDVVIYDRQRCPWIATEKAQTIWPYEFVYGVAEVKSALTEVALGEAIDKAAAFKSLKRQANEYARMPGFVSRTKPRNPPFAMVVAHTTDLDTRRILELIHQRPREQQLDVFGIIGGRVGMRCEKKPGPQIHIGVDHDAFAVLDFGDGAMAALLLITTAYLNGLHLDETADGLEYLRYLPFSAG
ncbi:MAG TPA: DUF6602 domain-containing protein [Polyangiaceae bacterium]